MNSPSIHREEPVKDFYARWNSNKHRHDAEESVDIGSCSHGKEMMQPNDEGEKGNRSKCPDHGSIAE